MRVFVGLGPSFVPAANAISSLAIEQIAERNDYRGTARDGKLSNRRHEELADCRGWPNTGVKVGQAGEAG